MASDIMGRYSFSGATAFGFLLLLVSLSEVSVAALPANKQPYAVVGAEISITGPKGQQARLSSETLVASIVYYLGNYWPGVEKVKEYPHIILAFYEDGTLIWSDDHTRGGPPYHMSRVPAKAIQELQERFTSTGLFRTINVSYCPMDAPSVEIFFKGADGYMQLQSSHELTEERPNLLAGEHDVRELRRGESRDELLAKESKAYQEFRASWSQVKRSLLDVIPVKDANGVSTVTIKPGLFVIRPAGRTGSR